MNTEVELDGPIQTLYSIGYGSRTIADFLETLKAHQITCVIDVRSSPYSRFKPEFSKEPLESALRRAGFRYMHLGDLLGGQPADPRCYVDGKVSYEIVRAKPFFLEGIDRLRNASRQRDRTAMMCSEGRPEQCHRAKLIGEALAALGISIAHIDEDGELRSQTEVIDRLTGGQLDLFGEPSFTSRKRYSKE